MKTLLTSMILMLASLSWAQDGVFTTTYIEELDSTLITVNTELDIDVAEFQLTVEGELVLDTIICNTLVEFGYDQCELYYRVFEGEGIAQSYDEFKVKAHPSPHCTMRIWRFYIPQGVESPLLIPSPNPNDSNDLNEAYLVSWCEQLPVGVKELNPPELVQDNLVVNHTGDVAVYSLTGQVVFEAKNFKGKIDLSDKQGLYVVRYQNNLGIHTSKYFLH